MNNHNLRQYDGGEFDLDYGGADDNGNNNGNMVYHRSLRRQRRTGKAEIQLQRLAKSCKEGGEEI